MGVLLTLKPASKAMRAEAASAGFYASPWGTQHPKIQILTVKELIAGNQIDYPPSRANVTFKKAPKGEAQKAENVNLPFDH